jgi:small subunit ribosomal protein S17
MIMTEQTVSRPIVVGKVVSSKMDKTIVVEVERKVKHPLYGKYMKRFSRMKAHDSENVCKVGDIVEITQSRPISKTKHWVLVKVEKQEKKDTE